MRTRIYTDGSYDKNTRLGTWSFVVCEERKNWSKVGYCTNATNNKMELKAVIKALAICKIKNIADVEIFTDSAYIINSLSLHVESWKNNNWKTKAGRLIKNYKEWKELMDLLNDPFFNFIRLIKIKAHSNITLNEKANDLAKNELKRKLEELENGNIC